MEYRIVRGKRKSLSLTVTRAGETVVRAPVGYPADKIEAFVAKHLNWIEKRLQERSAPPLDCAHGSCVSLFGKEYVVDTGKPAVEGGRIYLPAENREEAFCRLLKKLTFQVMGNMTEQIANAYGFLYERVRVSAARGRWGSCSRKGTLSYSFRNAFLSVELAEYVCVHELCHTQIFNHSAMFWKRVESVLPDYKLRRKKLKESGGYMNYL